jgi:endonuclease III
LDSKQLVSFLKVLDKWKDSVKEPVVERVKKKSNDPFAVLVATMLSLRTRDAVTEQVYEKLSKKVKNAEDLFKIEAGDLEKLIYPVGFYKTKAKALKKMAGIILEKHGGKVPSDLEELLELPGVGRKTANLVMTEAFGKYGICVDTHVHRILNWWGYVRTKAPEETEMKLREILPKGWWKRINGILVTFGQNICRPVAPRCKECPLKKECPYPGKRL